MAVDLKPLDQQVIVITGASSGIGLDLARLFAKDGNDVVLVARSEGKLRELAAELERDCGVKAHVIVAESQPDVTHLSPVLLPIVGKHINHGQPAAVLQDTGDFPGDA